MDTVIDSQAAQDHLRRHGLDARRSLSSDDRQVASEIICKKFLRSNLFFSANRIGVYLSTWDEVDTDEIILRSWRAKKQIFAPAIDDRNRLQFCALRPDSRIETRAFGIFEPVNEERIDSRQLDIVITPLAAFDKNRHRVGMGSGYYDRCFHYQNRFGFWKKPKLVGLSFSCQQVEEIQLNRWDIPLYSVITE